MSLIKYLRQPVLIVFALIYMLNVFTPFSRILIPLSTFLLIIMVLQTLPFASSASKSISMLLFLLGGVFLYLNEASYYNYLEALSSNTGLVVLFIVLPLLSFPLYYDDYENTLKSLSLKYINGPVRFGNISAFLTFFLCSILNIGAFAIIYELFKQTKEFTKSQKVLFNSMLRGNFAAIFWSPNYVGLAAIIHTLNVSWVSILPAGLLIAGIILLSNSILILLQTKKNDNNTIHDYNSSAIPLEKDKIRNLLFIFLGLISLVAILNSFTSLEILEIIPLVALFFPFVLAVFQKKLPIYKKLLHKYYFDKLLKINNEVLIFAAAGFFGKSLEISGIGAMVPSLLRIENIHQPAIAIFTIIFIVSLLAFVGVHPIVTTTTIGTTISAGSLGISLTAYTFVLIAAFGIAVMVSPVSGTTLVISGITKHSSFEMGPRLNKFYALGMAVFLAFFIPIVIG
ncbi:MAG: hypothetical protein GXY91_03720 [Clostridia bacterium]|nr:hypothetical protein [Clostridia bacterium]